MRKIVGICFLLFVLMSSSEITHAAVGDIIGRFYSTDILATFNGDPIPSYSIDGKTAIAVGDLIHYGYQIEYNQQYGSLNVLPPVSSYEAHPLETVRGKRGMVLGNVYETDIVTFINGKQVPCFVIEGKICVAIEDLGETASSPNATYGLSPYYMSHKWDPLNRIIALNAPLTVDYATSGPYNNKLERFGYTFLILHYSTVNEHLSASIVPYQPGGPTTLLGGENEHFYPSKVLPIILYWEGIPTDIWLGYQFEKWVHVNWGEFEMAIDLGMTVSIY